MTYSAQTATSLTDLHARLRTFLVTTLGWTELRYNATDKRVLVRAPGLSGTEEIHMGFGIEQNSSLDTYALTGWMFKAYESTFGDMAQPGNSAIGYHPVWNSSMPIWLFGNGQRIIIETKVSTRYLGSYLGKFLPYSAPSDYPQPYFMGMPQVDNVNRWSVDSADCRSFFDPGIASQVLHPNGAWFSAGNFFQLSGETDLSQSGGYTWPYGAMIESSTDKDRWREMRENLDGTYPRFPIQLLANNPAQELLGELDGAYAVPGFGLAAEDTVTVSATVHRVFQDNFRSNRWNYAAIPQV